MRVLTKRTSLNVFKTIAKDFKIDHLLNRLDLPTDPKRGVTLVLADENVLNDIVKVEKQLDCAFVAWAEKYKEETMMINHCKNNGHRMPIYLEELLRT
nr:hypothetical protein [Moritella viscosa]SHO15156.1 3-dehydroquinate synthase [Moritella viscosa]